MAKLVGCIVVIICFIGAFGARAPNCYDECTNSNLDDVGRVVFGEARGESFEGQAAVAFVIHNRVSHAGYPNTLSGVLNARDSNGNREFNTLDNAQHDRNWASAKRSRNAEYLSAIKAAKAALCGCIRDPTTCATDFCARDPCTATSSNRYWTATNKQKIGNHWFVCRERTRQ